MKLELMSHVRGQLSWSSLILGNYLLATLSHHHSMDSHALEKTKTLTKTGSQWMWTMLCSFHSCQLSAFWMNSVILRLLTNVKRQLQAIYSSCRFQKCILAKFETVNWFFHTAFNCELNRYSPKLWLGILASSLPKSPSNKMPMFTFNQ